MGRNAAPPLALFDAAEVGPKQSAYLGGTAGETLGLIGESGSGKTITVLSILRLLPRGARIVSGEVLFERWVACHLYPEKMHRITKDHRLPHDTSDTGVV